MTNDIQMRIREDGGQAYVDAVAMESASESCVRCSGRPGWKTAALIYEGPEWMFYYCYECQRWFRRHYRYRYAVFPLDDAQTIRLLVRNLETQRDMLEAGLESISWFRRRVHSASRFFQRYLP